MDHTDNANNPIAIALAQLHAEAPTVCTGDLPVAPPERFIRRGMSVGLHAAPADNDTPDYVDLDDIPELFMNATADYLRDPAPGYMLLIAAPAGAGKTRNAVRLAEQIATAGRRVLYAGPRRDFYADVQGEAQRPAWWYAWQPRQKGDLETIPLQQPTCRWAPQIEAWMARGYEAMTFCSNPRICGWEYMDDRCAYHKQRERGEPLIFGQHAHVALGHPLMDTFSCVIGDELPMAAFLHPWRIPAAAIVPPDMDDERLATLLRNLRYLASNPPSADAGQPQLTAWEGASLYTALPGGAQGVVDLLDGYSLLLDGLIEAPDLRLPDAADDAPYGHLIVLLNLLLRESRRVARGLDVIPRVRLDRDGLLLRLRHSPANLPKHVIWLDATGDAGIYSALFGRPVKVVRPEIPMRGTVYQLWHSTNNRRSLLDEQAGADGLKAGKRKQDQLQGQIQTIIQQRGYQNPATISYKPIGDRLLPGAPSVHFGAARGTNRLQDCDALFVIGAPMPTLHAIKEVAAMVFDERDEPWRGDWHARDIPFVGQAAAYTVGGFWDDADLTTLLRQMREAEIVQAVHRVRPLRRPVDVWLLTNVVTDLRVELVSLHQLIGAVDTEGKPIKGIDLDRWLTLRDLPATTAEPLTAARIMDRFAISRPTAIVWLDALLLTGCYQAITLAPESARKRPTRAIVKNIDSRTS